MVKSKRKGKQKQGVPATAGRSTSPRPTPERAVQADRPPEELPSHEEGTIKSPGMEEARQWDQQDAGSPVTVSPPYDLDEDEEFRNVWGSSGGGGEQSGQQ